MCCWSLCVSASCASYLCLRFSLSHILLIYHYCGRVCISSSYHIIISKTYFLSYWVSWVSLSRSLCIGWGTLNDPFILLLLVVVLKIPSSINSITEGCQLLMLFILHTVHNRIYISNQSLLESNAVLKRHIVLPRMTLQHWRLQKPKLSPIIPIEL